MRNSVKVSKYKLVEYDIPHRLRHNLYSVLARHMEQFHDGAPLILVKYINIRHQILSKHRIMSAEHQSPRHERAGSVV